MEIQWCRKVSDRRIWLTKFHSDWQNINISAACSIVRTDKIFEISPNDWHVQKDFNISVNKVIRFISFIHASYMYQITVFAIRYTCLQFDVHRGKQYVPNLLWSLNWKTLQPRLFQYACRPFGCNQKLINAEAPGTKATNIDHFSMYLCASYERHAWFHLYGTSWPTRWALEA